MRPTITGVPALEPDDLDGVEGFYREHGFALVRGLYDEALLAALDEECRDAQQRLTDGDLAAKHGTDILDDPEAHVGGRPFAHYVCYITELSPAADKACRDAVFPALGRRLWDDAAGTEPWLLDYERFGVVYQDARTGDGTYYARIGWHSDFQSGPHLKVWPSFAFTIHLDGTSPANGFLRVLPGSHRGGTNGMPPAFERVPGEIAVYAERGDVLLHDAHLWHSAARATDDGPAGIRRHLRGGWHGGERLVVGHGLDDFVKNAAR
jgi:phytanoyl-CoA dioxygenase PhyH